MPPGIPNGGFGSPCIRQKKLEQAMYIAGSKYQAFHFDQYQAVAIRELLPYVSGILKRRRQQQADGLCPCCGNPV